MTLGVVCSLPDGAAMLPTACALPPQGRSMRLSSRRWSRRCVAAGRGVFALQRHGMEHFWPDALLARARVDASLRDWLADPQARSEGLPSHLQSRWIDASVLPAGPGSRGGAMCRR